jgi:putative membrane protein
MMWWNDGWSMPWAFGSFMMIPIALLFLAVVLFIARPIMGSGRRSNTIALDILKERFARGEITEAEYQERRRLLEA